MSTFQITCPHCNNALNIVEEANGREITCLHCGNRLIPDLGTGIEPQDQTQPLIPTDTKNAVKTKGVPTMAKFIFTCPHCNGEMEVPPEYDGKIGTCPYCNKDIALKKTKGVAECDKSLTKHRSGGAEKKQSQNTAKIRESKVEHNRSNKSNKFKEPLIAQVMFALAMICYVFVGIVLFAFLGDIFFERGSIVPSIIFGSCLFQAVIYHGLSEYFSRSLRYQWETSENTKQLVEMLRK